MKNFIKMVLSAMLLLVLVACSKQDVSDMQDVSDKQDELFTQDESYKQDVISIIRHPRAVDFSADYPEYHTAKRNQLP